MRDLEILNETYTQTEWEIEFITFVKSRKTNTKTKKKASELGSDKFLIFKTEQRTLGKLATGVFLKSLLWYLSETNHQCNI